MITWENYEEYMMMHADGELNPAEEQALMAFVDEHPELKKDLSAYSMTKLVPDTEVVFEHKEQLLKEEKGRIIALPKWQRYSIAAGMAAIVFISLLKLTNNSTNNQVAAVKDDSIKNIVIPAVSEPKEEKNIAAVQDKTQIPAATSTKSIAAANPARQDIIKNRASKQVARIEKVQERAQIPEANSIAKIGPAGVKEIAGNSTAIAKVEETSVPVLPQPVIEHTEKETFFDKLPLNEQKKQNIKDMALALTTGLDKINEVKQEVNETSVMLRVQKRKLIVSF